MKNALFLLPLFAVLPTLAIAQMDPADYLIMYGNRNGTPLGVLLGDTIDLPVWGWTRPGVVPVAMMINSMETSNVIVLERFGGQCVYFPSACQFIFPLPGNPSCQSMIHLGNPQFQTNGDTVLIYTLRMWLTGDPFYFGQIVYPFYDCDFGHLWGDSTGTDMVIPTRSYGGLYFTSCNSANGDANGDGTFNGLDVGFSVNYLKGFGIPPPVNCNCGIFGNIFAGADANGNCQFNGIDVTYSVAYLKGLGLAPLRCVECEQ